MIADVGQIFATLLSTLWKKYKHLIEPIKEKIAEYKKKRAEKRRAERKAARQLQEGGGGEDGNVVNL